MLSKNAIIFFYVSLNRSKKYMACLWFTWLATKFLPPPGKPERLCLLCDVCPLNSCAFHLPVVALGSPFLEEALAISLVSRACFNHRWFFVSQYKHVSCLQFSHISDLPQTLGITCSLQPLKLWPRQSGTVLQTSGDDLHTKGSCYWDHSFPSGQTRWMDFTRK